MNYLPSETTLEAKMRDFRKIVAPHVSQAQQKANEIIAEELKHSEELAAEIEKAPYKAKSLIWTVRALVLLVSIDISLHWLL